MELESKEYEDWVLVEKEQTLTKLRFLTLNCAFLPHHLEFNNNTVLKPNLDRAEELAKQILEKDYDFVCLQEVWDTRVITKLKELLKHRYPEMSAGVNDEVLTYPNFFIARKLLGKDAELYKDESLAEQLKIHLNQSGLLFFGKLKILEKKSRSFANAMVGEELVAQKGYTAYKLLLGDRIIIVAFTHLHAGGSLWKEASVWWGGTSSHRRGEQQRMIHDDLIKSGWFSQCPAGTSFLDMFFMGDVNATFDNERETLAISDGDANNHFDKDEAKYEGQLEHMREYEPVFPENFAEIREPFARTRGAKKQIDPAARQDAEEKQKQTGTDLGSHPSVRMIDVLTIKKNPQNKMGAFVTHIVNFFKEGLGGLSDHNGIEGEYDPNAPRIERKSQYDDYVLVPTSKIDPSAGWWDRKFHPKVVNKFVPAARAKQEKPVEVEKGLLARLFGFFSADRNPIPSVPTVAPQGSPLLQRFGPGGEG